MLIKYTGNGYKSKSNILVGTWSIGIMGKEKADATTKSSLQ